MEQQFKYCFLSVALFLFQIIGYNVITLAILALSLLPIISANEFLERIKDVPLYFLFLIASLLIGLYFAIDKGIAIYNITYWGQFYFLTFILLAIKDKQCAMRYLKYCVYAICIADAATNYLLLLGFNLPWSEVPTPRPGETASRLQGVMNSALYSGSITFIGLCFVLEEKFNKKLLKLISVILLLSNIFLAGNYRYMIILIVLLGLYIFRLYRHRILLFAMYLGSIVVVYFATFVTMFVSQSNFSRFMIWKYFIGEIGLSPVIGHGLFNMHLNKYESFNWQVLIANGVTESIILLIGYCFGLVVLSFYLGSFAITLVRFRHYREYATELGLFLGLSLDLFWGGSLDNALSLCVLTLSLYIVNIQHSKNKNKDELSAI